jgi:hypothetical protein
VTRDIEVTSADHSGHIDVMLWETMLNQSIRVEDPRAGSGGRRSATRNNDRAVICRKLKSRHGGGGCDR